VRMVSAARYMVSPYKMTHQLTRQVRPRRDGAGDAGEMRLEVVGDSRGWGLVTAPPPPDGRGTTRHTTS